MKKITFLFMILLLLFVSACTAEEKPEKETRPSVSPSSGQSVIADKEELRVIFTFSMAPRLTTCQSTGYLPLQTPIGSDEMNRMIYFDFTEMTASFADHYPSVIDQPLFFSTDEFYYGINFGVETPVAYQFLVDGSTQKNIPLPSGWDFSLGQIAADTAGNLYTVLINVTEQMRGYTQLVKIDFQNEKLDILFEFENEQDAFSIEGTYQNDIVLSVFPSFFMDYPAAMYFAYSNRTLKLYQTGQSDLKPLPPAIQWHEIVAPEMKFVDPYDETYYILKDGVCCRWCSQTTPCVGALISGMTAPTGTSLMDLP